MSAKKDQGQQWRRWALILLSLSILAPTLSITTMLYFYLKDEVEARRAIAFMNFEQQAYRIKEMLRDETRYTLHFTEGQLALRFLREPRALMLKSDAQLTLVFGQVDAEDIKLLQKAQESPTDLAIFRSKGQLITATNILVGQKANFAEHQLNAGSYIALWNLESNFLPENLPRDTHHIYLINQQSSLIYSSVPDSVEDEVIKRPLVQDFIRSPLSRAGTPLRTSKTGDGYGFYMAVPDSNLVFFVESSASHFFAGLLGPTALALGILLSILGLTIMVWRSTVSSLQEQVQRLSQALDEFSKGYFIPTQLPPQNFLRELRPLVESINKNTRGVRDRVDLIEKPKK